MMLLQKVKEHYKPLQTKFPESLELLEFPVIPRHANEEKIIKKREFQGISGNGLTSNWKLL